MRHGRRTAAVAGHRDGHDHLFPLRRPGRPYPAAGQRDRRRHQPGAPAGQEQLRLTNKSSVGISARLAFRPYNGRFVGHPCPVWFWQLRMAGHLLPPCTGAPPKGQAARASITTRGSVLGRRERVPGPGWAARRPVRIRCPRAETIITTSTGGAGTGGAGPGEWGTGAWSPGEPVFTEDVEGSTRPAAYYLAESRDGLYVPYVLRTPADEGRFPFIFLAYGNGGGGIGWLRQWVHTRPYILERLLAAGYARGWGRDRTEVDLGFNRGGPLRVDGRQGMEVMNRSPLEFEDEVAILEHVRRHPRVDAGNLGHIGVSHAGEMLFKLASRYPGMLRAGVASEPANHEFLDLRLGDAAPVNPETGLDR